MKSPREPIAVSDDLNYWRTRCLDAEYERDMFKRTHMIHRQTAIGATNEVRRLEKIINETIDILKGGRIISE